MTASKADSSSDRDSNTGNQAEALISGQKQVLELIANGVPLGESLTALLRLLEAQAPDMVCSILLLEPDGIHVRHGAAPSLPEAFIRAVDGQAIGASAGSCGTAMFRRETVIVEDIATDPLWEAYRGAALPIGLHACWSTPIVDAQQRVLGSFAIYYRKPGRPTEFHEKLIDIATHIAAIAINREHTDAALRASEARYHKLFEYAPPGILIADAQSYYLEANTAICRMLGYTRQEMIGLHASNIVAPAEFQYIDPALNEIKTGHDYHREWKLKRKDGSLFDAEVIATVMPDGNLLGIICDITERKQTAEALRESEERFRQIAENIHEVFWVADTETKKFLYAGPMFEKIWGRPRQTLFADPAVWINAIHPGDRERVSFAAQKQLLGTYDEVYRILRPDGSVRWIRDRAYPVPGPDGKPYRIVGTAMDVTDQRKLEDQFHQAQKMEAIGQLAGGVAHDFNNLLMIIGGHMELLLKRIPTGDPLLDDLVPVQAAAMRATELTRQLLAFSRKQMLELKIVDLNAVITDSEKILRRMVGENISLSLQLDPALDRVRADASQLGQVLMNLAINARDAMPMGGNLFIQTRNNSFDEKYSSTHLEIKPGRYVQLEFSDTGTGMSKDVQAHIFEPFFTTKAPGKGTGLGLAVVHGVVKQSGGSIDVYSEPGMGASFKIYLPSAGPHSSAPETGAAARTPRGGNETILLVEDEKSVRIFLQKTLESAGYTVLAAADAKQALRIATAHGKPINVLITDVIMPGLSGQKLAASIRMQMPLLKVIFISGYTRDAALQLGHHSGEAAFLQKPFGASALTDKLREVLDG